MPSTSRLLRALEVADRSLRARAVAAVDVEVVAEGDESDLQLGDPIPGRTWRDVACRLRILSAQRRVEGHRRVDRHAGLGERFRAEDREVAVVDPTVLGHVEDVDALTDVATRALVDLPDRPPATADDVLDGEMPGVSADPVGRAVGGITGGHDNGRGRGRGRCRRWCRRWATCTGARGRRRRRRREGGLCRQRDEGGGGRRRSRRRRWGIGRRRRGRRGRVGDDPRDRVVGVASRDPHRP